MEDINTYWWLKPHALAAFFVAPLFLFLVLTFQESFGASFLNLQYITMGFLFIVVFALASFVTTNRLNRRKRSIQTTSPLAIRQGYLDFLAVSSIVAYVIWFRKLFFDPSLLIHIFQTGRGLENGVRGSITTIPGITTLTQLGVIYVIAYMGMKKVWKIPLREKRYRLYFFVIILLAVLRMFAWTERLALLEIIIPISVVWLSFTPFKRNKQKQKFALGLITKLGPYFGLILLFLFFAVTEYFRSWGSYYRFEGTQSFFPFIANRLFLYYSASINNGAGLLATSQWPDGNFTFLLGWLYNFPVIGGFLKNPALFNPTLEFLRTYANPQFNTIAALYAVFFDLGITGGLIFAAMWGASAGALYYLYVQRGPIGVLLYPVFYVSLLEILRELYLSETRSFPILVFALLGGLWFTAPIQEVEGT